MLNVTLIGDKELIQKFDQMPDKIEKSIKAEMMDFVEFLRTYVITEKLSGQVLNHITGNLWRSLQTLVTATSNLIVGKLYASSDCKYAGIHEYGGTIHMHARDFKVRLRVDRKGALIRQIKNSHLAVFAKGSHKLVTERDAHHGDYDIHMPERSYLRSSLRDQKQEFVDRMQRAVGRGIR